MLPPSPTSRHQSNLISLPGPLYLQALSWCGICRGWHWSLGRNEFPCPRDLILLFTVVNREDRVLAGPEKVPSTASLTLHRKRSAYDHSLPPHVGPTEPHNCVALKLLLPEENPLANLAPEATRSLFRGRLLTTRSRPSCHVVTCTCDDGGVSACAAAVCPGSSLGPHVVSLPSAGGLLWAD